MDSLIHEGAATIELPGAAPGAAIVVGLGAIPLYIGFGQGEPAEAALVDRGFHLSAGAMKTRREHRAEQDLVFLALLDDRVAALERDFERLFHDHMLAGASRGHGGLHVRSAGRADDRHIERGVGEHIIELGIGLSAEEAGELIGMGLMLALTGDQSRAMEFRDCASMKLGDHAATDNAEAERHC